MSKDIYNRSLAQIELDRQRAIEISENRKSELYRTVPQLEKIISAQNRMGIEMSREILKNHKESKAIVKDFQEKSYEMQKDKQKILEGLGLPLDYLNPPFTCKICEDTGFLGSNKCSCLLEKVKKEKHSKLNEISNLKLTGFNQFNLSYYPDSPDKSTNIIPRDAMENILNFTREYAKNFSLNSRSLLLLGGTGLGKTHLSLSIANQVINQGYGVIYGSAPNLIGQIENEKFGRTDVFNDSLSTLLEVDLLILDDLGSEFQTQFTVSTIYTIINTRLSKNLPTIISTNYNYKGLETAYNQRIFSRIGNNFESLFFWGNDIRRILKNQRDKE